MSEQPRADGGGRSLDDYFLISFGAAVTVLAAISVIHLGQDPEAMAVVAGVGWILAALTFGYRRVTGVFSA